jgi:hypothetical protein
MPSACAADSAPAVLESVTFAVKFTVPTGPLGVPLIAPVLVFKLNPAELLFMQSLRAYLATDDHNSNGHNSVGWLRGIRDPLVGRAISCMHADPQRRWTLQTLAEEVGCSRAVFAQKFSALVVWSERHLHPLPAPTSDL